ncbi:MAG: hypothetical protein R3195_13610 [Gemmatimonadota bacterium]|nr:hypothetical protein [Gemmatimonadota bacterium]
MHAFAVPFWISRSEMPELNAVGTVTEEERVDGILRLEGESLVLDIEVTQSTTTLDGMGQHVEKEHLGARELRIPFDELVELSVRRGWWFPCLEIRTSRLETLRGLTGAKQGVVRLRVSWPNRRAARTLVAELEIARADLALARAERLEGANERSLPSDQVDGGDA